MKASVWLGAPEPRLAQALRQFAGQATLAQEWFASCHGENYARFYQNGGLASHVVVEDGASLVAICGAVLREQYQAPHGLRRVLYLGALRLVPGVSAEPVLGLMLRALQHHYGAVDTAYCVALPDSPATANGSAALCRLGALRLWRLPTLPGRPPAGAHPVNGGAGAAAWRRLMAGQGVVPGLPPRRSLLGSQWWLSADGHACGRLDPAAMDRGTAGAVGAHLGAFAYTCPHSASRLLAAICGQLTTASPALYVELPESCPALPAQLRDGAAVSTLATVFGCVLLERSKELEAM